MAKKKNSAASGILLLVGFVIWAVSSIPQEVWIGLGIILVPVALIWLLLKNGSKNRSSGLSGGNSASPDESISVGLERNYGTSASQYTSGSGYRIPGTSSPGKDNAKWIPAEESIVVHGHTIKGGLFYFGQRLASQTGGIEPSLINPALPAFSGDVDISERLMGYWPSYQQISPKARSCYLAWLIDGRREPSADIGYVFLFFYGLERRVFVDAPVNPVAKRDVPLIIAEVRRLLSIYSSNHSFRRYAENFLQTIEIQDTSEAFYEKAAPALSSDFRELPFYMRIGLGQLAAAGKPVPAQWAFFWAFVIADYTQRKRLLRCPDVAEKFFSDKYKQSFGEGLNLPVNKTKLKLEYTPASSGIARGQSILVPGNLPDVSATSLAVKKLLPILASCAEELNAYGRHIARNAGQESSLEALLQLPLSLWPSNIRAELENLKSQIGNGQLLISFGELSGRLKSAGVLNRSKVLGLAQALEGLQIGIEPDVLAGARMPQSEDMISLFITPAENSSSRSTTEYKTAVVVLSLACAVANADGASSQDGIAHLSNLIDSWQHLSLSQRCRLKAYMRLQTQHPDRLTSIKKKLEPLTQEAKHSVAQYAVHMAQADGVVTPAEVKVLEKIYQAIGIDTQQLYSDLYAVGQAQQSGTTTAIIKSGKVDAVSADGSISLDAARIAMLKSETDQVSKLLAGVFSDEAPPEDAISNLEKEEPEAAGSHALPGLDAEQRAFVQVLSSRSKWARAELLDVAADMKLLLDGTLERINEASFDFYNEPFCEGEDPIEVNMQLMERLAA